MSNSAARKQAAKAIRADYSLKEIILYTNIFYYPCQGFRGKKFHRANILISLNFFSLFYISLLIIPTRYSIIVIVY